MERKQVCTECQVQKHQNQAKCIQTYVSVLAGRECCNASVCDKSQGIVFASHLISTSSLSLLSGWTKSEKGKIPMMLDGFSWFPLTLLIC